MKKVVIFGGGIGGLTVAHELCKYKDYQIEIYERNSEIGGLARSIRKNDCATEYCWRVFFGFYANLLRIMDELSVTNHLTEYKHMNISDTNTNIMDIMSLIYNVLYGVTSCDQRLEKLDNLTWWDALNTSSSSNLFRMIGPWLGMDRFNGSYNSVITVGMEMQILRNYKDYVTKLPTSEALFDPWEKYLLKNNVKIYKNTELSSVNISNNEIISTIVHNIISNKYKKITADHYIFSLPIEVLSEIIKKTPPLNYGQLSYMSILRDKSLHIQLSFQVYFNTSINIANNNAFLLIDSPWDLIVLSYDQSYYHTDIICYNNNIKGAWTIAVCTAYTKGILYDKPMELCSYDEIINEIWSQLLASEKLKQIIKDNNNFELSKELVVKWSPLWQSYYYKNGKLKTKEPKFTNNAGTLSLRPSIKTHIDNLFISTAYTKETINIFSMEAATISGIYVANLICPDIKKPIRLSRPMIFSIFRFVDKIMYFLDLPNINIILIICVIIYLFKFYGK